MPVSTANQGIHAKMTTNVSGDGGKPSPSKIPERVADPSHFFSVGSLGKNIITIAPQSDNNMGSGHHPHKGNTNIRQEANAQTAKRRTMEASFGIREEKEEDGSGMSCLFLP